MPYAPLLNGHDLVFRQPGDLVIGKHGVLPCSVVARRDTIPAEVRPRRIARLHWGARTDGQRWWRTRCGLADCEQAKAEACDGDGRR